MNARRNTFAAAIAKLTNPAEDRANALIAMAMKPVGALELPYNEELHDIFAHDSYTHMTVDDGSTWFHGDTWAIHMAAKENV